MSRAHTINKALCTFLPLAMFGPLGLLGQEQPSDSRRFRHYVGGKEAGGMEVSFSENRAHTKNRLSIERRGSAVEQDLSQDIFRGDDGSIEAEWTLAMGSRPQRGRVRWSPLEPGVLRLSAPSAASSTALVDADIILWPPDADKKMCQAAQGMLPLHIASYTFPFSAISRLDIAPEGADAVGIFTDAVRYGGTLSEGGSTSHITCWISPSAGQIKQFSSQGGLIVITQREELPPPTGQDGAEGMAGPGLFEWTLRRLPHTPFLAWRNEVRVHGLPDLPEGPQQKKMGPGTYLLSRAAPPSGRDALQPPIRGRAASAPSPEDAPYLADSPLLGLRDPAIDGLVARLNIGPRATRWEASRLVNAFVFDFIRDKGLDVGFAAAPEVAMDPRGDCTEHTVLAVALLRRLGVPARAAFGWAGFDDGAGTTLGLHAWAESKIGQRWVPIDPTFGQAPAGAIRATLNTSALNSVAELGWGAGMALLMPLATLNSLDIGAAPLAINGDELVVDGTAISHSKGAWAALGDRLFLEHPQLGQIAVNGGAKALDPPDAKLIHAKALPPVKYAKSASRLSIDCGRDRWLYFEPLTEDGVLELLDGLKIRDYTSF